MIKNTAGQKVGVQMVSATDGSAFTSAVTAFITLDAGTQAQGTVGSGACTHEGNGYHTYAPSQAETNGDLVAVTFTGTGAVPTSVQIYTVAGDAFTRLGAPVGASISADIAGVQSDTNDLQTRIPAALVSGRIDASVGAMATDVLTNTALAASAVTEIQAGLSTLDAAGVRTAVGLASANLDTQLDALPTAAENADAVWDEATTGHVTAGTFGEQAKTDIDAILVDTAEIGAAGAGLTAVPWNAAWDAEVQSEVTDALEVTLSDSIPADGTLPSVKQALYMLTQFMLERSVTSTTVTVKKADGSTTLFTLTLNDATTPTSITRAT